MGIRLHGTTRGIGTALGAALAAIIGAALPSPCPPGAGAAFAQDAAPARADFATFLRQLWPKAREAGVTRATFDSATAALEPDPALAGARASQPEFTRPVSAYVKERVTAARVARGRAEARLWAGPAGEAERREGVPAALLVALWGIETDFGRVTGTKDVLRSLATLAYAHPDRPLYGDELVSALLMLQAGIPRARLRGSWSGAMGQPQFMPSAWLAHAVRPDGSRPGDIWTSPADTLASIGDLLRAEGWRRGLGWGAPVALPDGFDFAAHRQSVGRWRAAGLLPPSARSWPDDAQAVLYFPAGARGPAFLLTDNFFVIKAYNTSDAYALSAGLLADAIAGLPGPARPWPANDTALTRSEQAALQAALARLGHYDGPADGKIGPAMRDAIHSFQRAAGISPADGHPSPSVLEAARKAAGP